MIYTRENGDYYKLIIVNAEINHGFWVTWAVGNTS